MARITINGISIDPVESGQRMDSISTAMSDATAGYALVQTSRPLEDEDREQIAALGVELLEYVPDDSYVASFPRGEYEALRSLDCVRWAGPYFRGFKVASELLEAPETTDAFELMNLAESGLHESQQVTIVLHRDADADRVRSDVAAAAGLEVGGVEVGRGLLRASVPTDRLNAISAIGAVRHIEPVYEASLSNEVAMRIVRADVVHNGGLSLRGRGETVAVCDTGFDEGSTTSVHPAFSGRVAKLYARGRSTADDPHGHGTHVAGSVLGDGNTGGRPNTGTAPEARLVLQSVLDAAGGLDLPVDLSDLFAQTYEDDARVHTNSWGTTRSAGHYTAYSRSVDQFVWEHRDQVICFAAGNPGGDRTGNGVIDLGSVEAPGTAKNCITVGASESLRPSESRIWGTGSWRHRFPAPPIRDDLWANDPNGMAAFSGRGPTRDGRVKPDIVAPGTSILSAHSRRANVGTFWGTSSDPLYCYMGGTSMATPIVAGAAAVVRQLLKSRDVSEPSAALVKAALINGAVDLHGQYIPSECGDRPNHAEGFGRLNLERSVGATPTLFLEFHEEADALSQGEEWQLVVPATEGMSLKATLVWTDPAGDSLQNDLDLTVACDGREMHGNVAGIFPSGSGHFDRANNVEQVIWNGVPGREARIGVRAHRIALLPQQFALVVRVEAAADTFDTRA